MKTRNLPDIETAIWGRIAMDKTLSTTSARALLAVQFPQEDHERMRHLSAKARSGTLTAPEEKEIDAYERLGCLLDILHSKARQALKRG